MRLIDADALYERLRDDEDLARQRVIDTPNSFPNGMLNPAAVRYMAQLSERTRFKEIVYDAPTIEPERKTGKWSFIGDNMFECTCCGTPYTTQQLNGLRNYNTDPYAPKFCPNCGADMRGDNHEND